MRANIVSVVLAILIIGGGIGLSGVLSSQKEPAPRLSAKKRVQEVTYRTVSSQTLPTEIFITGRLAPKDQIELFAEVTGTYTGGARPFKEGTYFKKGESMIDIDDREFTMTLKAQKSALMNQLTLILPDLKTDYPESFPQWQSYLQDMDLGGSMAPLPEPKTEQERYFLSAKNLYNQYYSIRSQEVRGDKYHILAPFSGKVATSSIDQGTLVRVGQKIGEFFNPYVYELEASVNLSELPYVKQGSQVSLRSEDVKGQWTGRVVRISDMIDPATQTVRVFVVVSGQNLKSGMYLEGEVQGRKLDDVVEVPRNLLVRDSGLYIIHDIHDAPVSASLASDSTSAKKNVPMVKKGTLAFQAVVPVQFTKNSVFVRGLKPGSVVVDEALINAHDGMEVILYENQEG
jgi:multidrug efflux pump subunit AcrA (membrane-fusion protein)